LGVPRHSSGVTSRKKPPTRRLEQTPFQLSNDAIEQALLTGEFPGLLEDYFGEQNYLELQHLARDAAAQRIRGGPRVFILPGILGSTLGKEGFGPFDDVIWFDPIDIFNGRLAALAINGGSKAIKPLGVVQYTYLRLKLNLVRDGYDADRRETRRESGEQWTASA